MRRLYKWAAILIFFAVALFAAYQWGYSRAETKAAEQKSEAIQKAVEKREKEYQQQLQQVQQQAQQYRKRLNQANEALDKKDSRIEDMEDGEKACFDKKSLGLYNQY